MRLGELGGGGERGLPRCDPEVGVAAQHADYSEGGKNLSHPIIVVSPVISSK